MEWEQYIGKIISVLIVGKGDKEENYVGIIKDVIGDFMILDTSEANIIISEIAFRTHLIKSIWIYKPKSNKKKKLALRDKYGLGYLR